MVCWSNYWSLSSAIVLSNPKVFSFFKVNQNTIINSNHLGIPTMLYHMKLQNRTTDKHIGLLHFVSLFFLLVLKVCFICNKINRKNYLTFEGKWKSLTCGYKVFIYGDELSCIIIALLTSILLWAPSLDSIVCQCRVLQ